MSFCSHQLMEMLAVKSEKTALLLTTLGKQNSMTECRVLKLDVFYLDEHNYCFWTSTIWAPHYLLNPKTTSKDSISQHEDVSKYISYIYLKYISYSIYIYLKDIQLLKINACIGLIGNDVLKALEHKEIRECKDQGWYAVRIIFRWTINGP